MWGHGDALRGAALRQDGRLQAGAGLCSRQAVLLCPVCTDVRQGKAHRRARLSRASSGAGGGQQPPGCPGRRMLPRPHRCAEPSRSAAQPLLGPVAAVAVHNAAQQLVPAVPTAGKSTFPRGRAACICPSTSQLHPAFPVRVTAPFQTSSFLPVPAEIRLGVPCLALAAGGALCMGSVVPQRWGVLVVWGDSRLGTLCPNSPHAALPSPAVLAVGLLSLQMQDKPQLPPQGKLEDGRAVKGL